MNDNPYRLKQARFAHFLWLVLMPAASHGGFTLAVGMEAETSFAMLLSSVLAAAFAGGYLGKKGYGAAPASLASAWPAVLAAHGRWHWALGMSSPGGSAQNLVRALGWSQASMTEAVAVVMVVSGAAGWLAKSFDRWYKRKTGRSLINEE